MVYKPVPHLDSHNVSVYLLLFNRTQCKMWPIYTSAHSRDLPVVRNPACDVPYSWNKRHLTHRCCWYGVSSNQLYQWLWATSRFRICLLTQLLSLGGSRLQLSARMYTLIIAWENGEKRWTRNHMIGMCGRRCCANLISHFRGFRQN